MRSLHRFTIPLVGLVLAACTAAPVYAQSQDSLISLVRSRLDTVTAAATAVQAIIPAPSTLSLTKAQDSLAAIIRTNIAGILADAAAVRAMLPTTSTTTTPPVQTSPPPSTPPSTTTTTPPPSSSSYTTVRADSFAQYKSTAAFLGVVSTSVGGTASPSTAIYNDGGYASLAAIDNTVLYHGHATLKYNQPAGSANTPELWVNFTPTLTHLWFRAKIRFGPGFTTTGTSGSGVANAYKLLGWAFSNYDGSGRIEITNTNQYQAYWNAQSKSGGKLVGGGVFGQGGAITAEWSDGKWYDYIIDADFSKSPAVARLWIAPDGQTPILRATSSGTMQGGAALPLLSGVMLGLNFNQVRAASQTQALWYGQWEVVDGSKYPHPFGL